MNGPTYFYLVLITVSTAIFCGESRPILTSENAHRVITDAFENVYTKKDPAAIKKALEDGIALAWKYIDKREFNIDDMRTFTCFSKLEDYVSPLIATGTALSPVEEVLNAYPLAKKSTLIGSLVYTNMYTVKNAFLAKLCVYTRSPRLSLRIAYIYNQNPDLNVRFVIQAHFDAILAQIKAKKDSSQITKRIHTQFLLLPKTEALISTMRFIHEYPYRSEKEFQGSYFHGLGREIANYIYRIQKLSYVERKNFIDGITALIKEEFSHLCLYPMPLRHLRILMLRSSDGKEAEETCADLSRFLPPQSERGIQTPFEKDIILAIIKSKHYLFRRAQAEVDYWDSSLKPYEPIINKIRNDEQLSEDDINTFAYNLAQNGIPEEKLTDQKYLLQQLGEMIARKKEQEINFMELLNIKQQLPPEPVKAQIPPQNKIPQPTGFQMGVPPSKPPVEAIDLFAEALYKIIREK